MLKRRRGRFGDGFRRGKVWGHGSLATLKGGGSPAIIAEDEGGLGIGEWDFRNDRRRRNEDRGYKRIRDVGADRRRWRGFFGVEQCREEEREEERDEWFHGEVRSALRFNGCYWIAKSAT